MRIMALALREFRANWRRNAIFGAIMLLAIGVQLFTTLSAAASREAVSTYGTAVYGYAETWRASLKDPLTVDQLDKLNTALAAIHQDYPWFEPVTAVNVSAYLSATGNPILSGTPPSSVLAVSPNWHLLTSSIGDDDAWRSVTSDQRRSAALLVDAEAAGRLGITAGTGVTVVMDAQPAETSGNVPATGQEQIAAGGNYTQRHEMMNTPVFGIFSELNKSLATDVLASQQILRLGHAGPRQVEVYWRCQDRCHDVGSLLATAAATAGTTVNPAGRIDEIERFGPVLQQQEREGERFGLIVLILGTLAVAIVSTAFIEVRAPQFATLRALGATRPAVGMLALLENLLTAAVVGAVTVLLGIAATRIDPNLFNQLPDVHLVELAVPARVYVQTALVTLAVGLLTGLAPAVRAYRSVRTA